MRALILVAASAAAQTCPASLISDKITTPLAGGTLYVSDGSDADFLNIVDLGDAAVAAGCRPAFKPHMVIPSPDNKLVAISYTGDKFVHLVDATTKSIVACLDATNPATGVEGGTIHTGAWHGDDAFLMCDMTGSVNGVGGGAIHKFSVDRTTNEVTYESSLSVGGTDVQAARGTTETKPIALETNRLGASGRFFVTDAKGGGSIIDAAGMSIVRHVSITETAPCSKGGLWVEPVPETGSNLVVAQYGFQSDPGATDNDECLVAIDLGYADVERVFELPPAADDAHGLQFCKNTVGALFVVNTNRVSATIDVLDPFGDLNSLVVGEIDLNGLIPPAVSGGKAILQPDVIYLDGASNTLYVAGRGPKPVSAVKPANFNPDAVAGLYAFTLGPDCVDPAFAFFKPVDTSLPQSGNEADCHGVWGVNEEIWIIDQAATGTVKTTQTFYKCAADEIPDPCAGCCRRRLGGRNLRFGAVVDDCSACEC